MDKSIDRDTIILEIIYLRFEVSNDKYRYLRESLNKILLYVFFFIQSLVSTKYVFISLLVKIIFIRIKYLYLCWHVIQAPVIEPFK